MRNYQISIFRTQGVHTCAYKTKGGTDTKPNAVENTRRFFLNEVATEKLSTEQTAACVLAPPPPPLSETSELVYCVADLQMSNQKLQEEVRKLKQVVEGMEDSNQKLAEENEELRNQARV